MDGQHEAGVRLAISCPGCGGSLDCATALCSCSTCGRDWPVRDGIPSFGSTDFYWGEIPRAEMRGILDTIRRNGWDDAVHRDLAVRFPDRYRYIFDPIRADWFYVGNVQVRGRALDLGAGWGGLSLQLSRVFEEVVAVEGVWERAQFASMLFRNQNASNVQTIHADIHALPLPEESFDLVAMNGVLEWAALGGDEPDPESAQGNLLAKAARLLRPGGSLYVGIENRFALIFLIGGRDHLRPRWMGVLPRPLAAWYGRRCGVPQRHPVTHSPAGYRRLLTAAGLEEIGFHAAFPSYSHPRILVPLSHPSGISLLAKLGLDWNAAAMGFGLRVLHRLLSVPGLARQAGRLAESLVIWARRPGCVPAPAVAHRGTVAASAPRECSYVCPPRTLSGQLVARVLEHWDELGTGSRRPASLAATQCSSNWGQGGRITHFLSPDSSAHPVLVARISRTASGLDRVGDEHRALISLRQLSGELHTHTPIPLALWSIDGHAVSLQSYVRGAALARALAREDGEDAAATALRLCAPFLTRLAQETRVCAKGTGQHRYLDQLMSRVDATARDATCSTDEKEVLLSLAEVARRAEPDSLPTVAHHGDLNVADIMIQGDRFLITDWEWYEPAGLPFLDLVILGLSAAETGRRNDGRATRNVVMSLSGASVGTARPGSETIKSIGAAYCAALGLTDDVRPALTASALLHAMVLAREARYAGESALPWFRTSWMAAVRVALSYVGGRLPSGEV